MSPEDAEWLIARMLERGMRYSAPEGPPPGRRAVQDFNQERVLDRLLVDERRIEHSLYRTMAELRTVRRLRGQGGVSSGKGGEESSCQTNPIGPGVSSLKSEVASECSPLSEEVGRGRIVRNEPNFRSSFQFAV